jgi:hypothetical protein
MKKAGDIHFKFHFAPEFWHFVLSTTAQRKLCAVSQAAGSRSLVRLAFKSFIMGIPFCNKLPDGTDIDPCVDQLFNSHQKKVERMKDWSGSPFLMHKLVSKSEGCFFKLLGNKVHCCSCTTGRANRACRQTLCKKCCIKNMDVSKCAAHGKGVSKD